MNLRKAKTQYQNYWNRYIEKERDIEKQFHIDEIFRHGKRRERLGRAVVWVKGNKIDSLDDLVLLRFGRKTFIKTDIQVQDVVLLASDTLYKTANKSKKYFEKKCEDMPFGTVETVGKNFIDVWVQKPIPSFVLKGSVDIQSFMNDITYTRQMDALHYFVHRTGERFDKLCYMYLGEAKKGLVSEQLDRSTQDIAFGNTTLNNTQKSCIQNAAKAPYIHLVHGPFGTGKTTSLVELIKQEFGFKSHILACADSNTAVDNMLLKLAKDPELKDHIVRVGPVSRLQREELYNVSIYKKIQDHPDYTKIQNLEEEINKSLDIQKEYGKPSQADRRGLSDQQILQYASRGQSMRGVSPQKMQEMATWVQGKQHIDKMFTKKDAIKDAIIHSIIKHTPIVLATNSMVYSDLMKNAHFDVSIIDEASQSTEPSCLMPITVSNRFILAGDHKQLPPTVLSKDAQRLSYSLFERLTATYMDKPEIYHMLNVQYRMNNELMEFPNTQFYNGKLRAAPQVQDQTLADILAPKNQEILTKSGIYPQTRSRYFYHVEGDEQKDKEGKSRYNYKEIDTIYKLVQTLIKAGIPKSEIGVISPYKAQKHKIEDALQDEDIEVNTVDGFQGREKEVILISFVRSNPNGELGFLTDYRRLNVAITRAKRLLVGVGNKNTLANDTVYQKFVQSLT